MSLTLNIINHSVKSKKSLGMRPIIRRQSCTCYNSVIIPILLYEGH